MYCKNQWNLLPGSTNGPSPGSWAPLPTPPGPLQINLFGEKRCHFGRSFREGFDFGCQGMNFGRVLVGSRRSPACFLQGLAPSMVRWEVSYKGKSFQKKLEIWSGAKFRRMSQIGQGAPPRHPKNPKKYAQKGPGPILGPGSLYDSRSTRLGGPLC